MNYCFFILILSISFQALSYEIDSQESRKKYDIELRSGKKDDVRYYEAKMTKVIDAPMKNVKESIINFDQKCNNDYSNKRKFTDENNKCKYHNPSLVESIIIKDINVKDLSENEEERFLVNRLIYNTNTYNHSDLIQIFNKSTSEIVITHTMLESDEAKKYNAKAYEKDSAFDHSKGTFTLTSLSPTQTKLDYIYVSTTDHWVLNKSVSISKVFDSMTESFNHLFQSIKSGSSESSQKRITSSEK
jgi:hypothetical protein